MKRIDNKFANFKLREMVDDMLDIHKVITEEKLENLTQHLEWIDKNISDEDLKNIDLSGVGECFVRLRSAGAVEIDLLSRFLGTLNDLKRRKNN